MIYRLSRSATEDFADILVYFGDVSPKLAFDARKDFLRVCDLLASQPGIGHPRKDIHVNVREWNPSGKLRSYRIFYYVEGETVVIYQVLHGARDQNTTLRAPEED